MGELDGKTYLVTGGSKGIGYATAEALIKRGAKVAITARGEDALKAAQEKLGKSTIAIPMDVASKASVVEAFQTFDSHFDHLDGLINNAGTTYPKRIEALSEADIRTLIDVNFTGTVFCTQEAIPRLRANGGGRILNISSATARHKEEFPHMSMYGAAKAAVDRFSIELREEVKADGIGVTVLSPGAVLTSLYDGNMDPDDMAAAYEDWFNYGPKSDGIIEDPSVIGETVANCLSFPQGMAVDFIEIRPNVPTNKAPDSA